MNELACFFCGVDSKATTLFFVFFVSCLSGAGLFLLLWAISKGDFKNIEGPKYDVLKHEKDL